MARTQAEGNGTTRVTATITQSQHQALDDLAKKHGVSVAWLVRKAVDLLIEEAEGGARLPLDLK